MKRSDFHFDLPAGLIAQQPLERRSDSRLLRLSLRDGGFCDRCSGICPSLLRADDLLVFNDTRVIRPGSMAARNPAVKWRSCWSGC